MSARTFIVNGPQPKQDNGLTEGSNFLEIFARAALKAFTLDFVHCRKSKGHAETT